MLVGFDPRTTDAERLGSALRAVDCSPGLHAAGELVEIAVSYDGDDLDDVAAQTGLTREAVVAAHAGAEYVVAFCGFAPGFAYLTGLDDRLRVSRRDSPPHRGPGRRGGIAGRSQRGLPAALAGGWQLIGHTETVLWDVERDPPALLRPGTRVRFEVAS